MKLLKDRRNVGLHEFRTRLAFAFWPFRLLFLFLFIVVIVTFFFVLEKLSHVHQAKARSKTENKTINQKTPSSGPPQASLSTGSAASGDPGSKKVAPSFFAPDLHSAPIDDLVSTELTPEVDYGRWIGTSFGAIMIPKQWVHDSSHLAPEKSAEMPGEFDVVFHFNGAMMANKEWRKSRLNAVIVSVAGPSKEFGSAVYSRMFATPSRFRSMLSEVQNILKREGVMAARFLRHVGIVSWSAGFGAVGRILSDSQNRDLIDSLVLLDSLHAPYLDPKTKTEIPVIPVHPHSLQSSNGVTGLGWDAVNPSALTYYLQFAREALAKRKLFVFSSSSILPTNYASCSETIKKMLSLLGVHEVESSESFLSSSSNIKTPMQLRFKADEGNVHVRVFRGANASSHFQELYLVGDMVSQFLSPRWFSRAKPRFDSRVTALKNGEITSH